jgi:hypothetical protein
MFEKQILPPNLVIQPLYHVKVGFIVVNYETLHMCKHG